MENHHRIRLLNKKSAFISSLKSIAPHFMLLSLLCLVIMVLVVILIVFTSGSIINKNLHFVLQDDHNAFARTVTSKYTEVASPSLKGPTILDPKLKTQVIFKGLRYPTSIALLGPNDILVTEKDEGTVRRIINGTEQQQPLLNVSVATFGHRGMLGISISPHPSVPVEPRNPTSYQ